MNTHSTRPAAKAPAALPRLVTQADVAEALRVSTRTVEGWRVSHAGPPYYRIGGRIRYDLAQVSGWLREQAVA